MRETVFTEAIIKAISDCLKDGKSEIELSDSNQALVSVKAKWEAWEVDETYSVISIYLLEDGEIKFRYQIEETKVYE